MSDASTASGPRICRKCGNPVPRDAPEGNCPSCLLGLLHADEPRESSAASSNELSTTFAGYELISEIAQGGMGVVYRARQRGLNRLVALKMIRAGRLATREEVNRFRNEAEAAAKLDHPNIVPIYEVGEHEGQHYFTMRLMEGGSLAQRTKNKDARNSVLIISKVARAVDYAHKHGVLHRDLKPSNILQDAEGEPHVSDFGLAKILAKDSDLTGSQAILGSPSYMAPEQAAGKAKQVTTAADVYSLGAILYELLTGQPPFVAETPIATMRMAAEEEPQPPRALNPALDRELETICLKCLNKNPRERYESANALGQDLEFWLRGEPVCARPARKAERFVRWCRRKPALASATGAAVLLLLTVLIGSPIAAWRISAARLREHQERERAMDANRQLVEANRRLASTVVALEHRRAEDLFASGDAAAGLVALARALRQNPSNHLAAARLISAFTYRDFVKPVGPPLMHSGQLRVARFSPNGRLILTASDLGTVRLWRWPSLEPAGDIQHGASLRTASFSPDSARFATGSEDGQIGLWSAGNGTRLGAPMRHDGPVAALQFSPDGQRLLSASTDKTARVWDAHSGQLLVTFSEHSQPLTCAAFSPDGERIITGSEGGGVRVWNSRTGERVLPNLGLGFGNSATWVEFSPRGDSFVTASTEGTAQLWNATTAQALCPPLRHRDLIYTARFSPDGRYVVTASRDFTARIWDASTGQSVGPPLTHNDIVSDAEFNADGRCIVTTSIDLSARVWDALTGQMHGVPMRHAEEVADAQFSPDCRIVITAGHDSMARIWNVERRRSEGIVLSHGSIVHRVSFSPDGRIVATTSNNRIHIWHVKDGEPVDKPIEFAQPLTAVEFSSDGRSIVAGSRGGEVKIWDTTTCSVLASFHHEGAIRAVRFDRDRVATASSDQTARLWDARTGLPLTPPMCHEARVTDIVFSPDGEYVATTSYDLTARVWNARTGKPITPALRHDDHVEAVVFSPDGTRIVTAANDNTARVWDARSGQPLFPPLRHWRGLRGVAFSPNGARLLTTSLENVARLWDSHTGQLLSESFRHSRIVWSAQFSPDGQRIVTGAEDGTVRVWDTETGLPLTEEFRHAGSVRMVRFSPDGQWVLSASFDRTARLWEVPTLQMPAPSWLPELAEAVAGQRLTEQNTVALVSWENFEALRSRLFDLPDSNVYTRVARWWFAEPTQRSSSPSAFRR